MALCRREIARLLPRFLRYAYALVRDQEMAADLVRETALKALAANCRLQDAEALRPWLFTILRNTWLDRMRRHRTRGDGEADAADMSGIPRDTVMSRLSRARRALIARMESGNVRSIETARRRGKQVRARAAGRTVKGR